MNETEKIAESMDRIRLLPGVNMEINVPIRDEFDALALASKIARWSTCQSKRGVVIWRPETERALSVGINHQARGFTCDGSDACKLWCGRTAIHAEESAILHFKGDLRGTSLIHVKYKDGIVPSGKPSCVRCSGMIMEIGISKVWLLHKDGLRWYDPSMFHASSMHQLKNRDIPF